MTVPIAPAALPATTTLTSPTTDAAIAAAELTATAVRQASITQAEVVATEAAVAARARAAAAAAAAGDAEVAAKAASRAAAGVELERNRHAIDNLAAARHAEVRFGAASVSGDDSADSQRLASLVAAVAGAEAEVEASDLALAAATAVAHAVEVAAATAAMAVVASAAEFERSVVSTAMAAANLATQNAATAATAVLVGVRTADLPSFGSAETPLFVQLVTPRAAAGADQHLKPGAASTGAHPRLDVDTHEVSVSVDHATGEYALTCSTCEWRAPRGAASLHSWRARDLDRVLLTHVDLGDLFAPASEPAPFKPYPQTVSDIGRAEIFGPRQNDILHPEHSRMSKLRRWRRR